MDLFRTKPVENIQEDSEGGAAALGLGRLRQHLSARHLIGFGVGVVIGTGIFTLTGVEARTTAGPAVVISFVVAGVVALLAALCYAELASAVPTAGSAYSYTYATTGELLAWIIGWDLFLEFALGAAVVARGWSGYVGNLITVSRIGFAMGRDGLLPPAIARVSPRTGTPVRMTLLYAAVVLVMATFVPLSTLADLVSIGTLFAFVLVSAAVPVLRRSRPGLSRPFRAPLSPLLPVGSALACLYLMANLSIETWLRFLAWLVIGLLVYGFYGYRHSRVRRDARAADVPAAAAGPR